MALSFFKKATTGVATLRGRRAALSERHTDAQNNILSAQDKIAALLIDNAERATVTKAQAELVNAERDATATADAIARLDAEIGRMDAEHAVAEDRKARETTVAQLAKHEANVNDAAVSLIKALSAFADATDPIVPTVIDAAQTNVLTRRLAAEFPQATALITNMIRHHASEVLSGRAPRKLAAQEPAPASNMKRAPEVAGLVAMKPICWSEGDNTRVAAKGWPVVLPAALAEHAVAIRAALPPGHFEAAALSNNPRRSRDLPRIADCVALDKMAEEAKQAAMKEAAIEESAATLAAPELAPSERRELAAPIEHIDRGPTLVGTAEVN
ncbi:hypothetical protein [Bradyrhizobium sp. LB11.1]|uniref:hypothetical protein n=1 Tax=Bradyrhizobium sp. LB11.1 TaxID=3156326 RepID=UPI003391AA59